MKKLTILLILLFTLATTACSSTISTETRPSNEVENRNQGPRPTPTTDNRASESTEPGVPYPGGIPETPPTVTPYPEGYPAPPEIPTQVSYPADEDTVWMLHPVGVQCEDAAGSKYQSEQDVIAGFTAAGITVHEVTTTELMVCTACGCPASAHYRAEINATDIDKAVALGWELE